MASLAFIRGSQERTTRLAFVFLLCGATCIGMAPILVRSVSSTRCRRLFTDCFWLYRGCGYGP